MTGCGEGLVLLVTHTSSASGQSSYLGNREYFQANISPKWSIWGPSWQGHVNNLLCPRAAKKIKYIERCDGDHKKSMAICLKLLEFSEFMTATIEWSRLGRWSKSCDHSVFAHPFRIAPFHKTHIPKAWLHSSYPVSLTSTATHLLHLSSFAIATI